MSTRRLATTHRADGPVQQAFIIAVAAAAAGLAVARWGSWALLMAFVPLLTIIAEKRVRPPGGWKKASDWSELSSWNEPGGWKGPLLHLLIVSVFVESLGVGPLSIGRLLSVAAVIAIIYALYADGWRVNAAIVTRGLPVFALVVSYAVSGFWSHHRDDWLFALGQLALALAYFGAFALLLDTDDTQRQLHPLMRTYAFGSIGAAVIAAIQGLVLHRAVGLQGDPNIFALYQVMAVPVVFGLARRAHLAGAPRQRNAWLAALPLLGVSILASGSRGGIAALVVTIVAISTLARASTVHRLVAAAVTAGLIITVSLLTNARATNVGDDRASGRMDIWIVSWQTFSGRAWSGIGAGNLKPESVHLLETTPGVELVKSHLLLSAGIEVHNLYLEALVERGVFGLAILLWMLIQAGFLLNRARHLVSDPVAAALTPMLLAFTVAAFFLSVPNNKMLWILVGLSAALPTGRAISRRGPAMAGVHAVAGQRFAPSEPAVPGRQHA